MLLKIQHALLEVGKHPLNQTKQSAIIINNEFIITTGSILQPYLLPTLDFESSTKKDIAKRIIQKLRNCDLINAQTKNCDIACDLNTYNYQVTFDQRKLPKTVKNRHNENNDSKGFHILKRFRATLLYIFATSDFSNKLHNVYRSVNEMESTDVLRSSFLLLSLSLRIKTETFQLFLQQMGSYLRFLHPLYALDDVLVMCSPFGLEYFYKTVSIGKISKVMDNEECLFSISNVLPLGCEGSAVFNKNLHLIGIILCTSLEFQHQNVNFTLVANFTYILRDFMRQLNVPLTMFKLKRDPPNFAWERTLVIIESGESIGSGIFIKVLKKKFILTCAHVVGQLSKTVKCRAVDGTEFQANVLWCHPQFNHAYDLALLTIPTNLEKSRCARLSEKRPFIGQTIYNAGFPYFVNLNLKYDLRPSIFEGRIIKHINGAIISDGCVQAGQSGGPMFEENGCLLGVCVSNLQYNNVIYPNLNSAVPIFYIRKTLEDYAKSNDVTMLNDLVANQEIQKLWRPTNVPTNLQSKL